MQSINDGSSTDAIADVLWSLRGKGVRIWSEDGLLRYEAPKGAIAPEDIAALRASKDRIIAFLERAHGARSMVGIDCAPLTYSQLSHWRLYRLDRERAIRQIASAIRLRGRLDVKALQESLAEVVRRHDALRTRIVTVNGLPMQQILAASGIELRVDDLRALRENRRDAQVLRIIDEHILEPIDIAVDPLIGARLLRLRDDEHVLIIALEHIISDAFSKRILLNDLFLGYVQAISAEAFSLPEVLVQFSDYAIGQWSSRKSWLEKHEGYWNRRLAKCGQLRFPNSQDATGNARAGAGTAYFKIGKQLKAQLSAWCRLRHMTLARGVFTAYVALVLRWCRVSEAVILYSTDGRVSHRMQNAIGFFASSLYLRATLLEEDTFVDLAKRLGEEYCSAFENADYCYLTAQIPCPEFTNSTSFNWIPQGAATHMLDADRSGNAIACSPVRFTHPMIKTLELNREPGIQLHDSDEDIDGFVYFGLDRFSQEMMNRFVRNLYIFLDALLHQPEARVQEIALA